MSVVLLVVADSPDRRRLGDLLSTSGLRADVVHGAPAAYRRMVEAPPDCLVVELGIDEHAGRGLLWLVSRDRGLHDVPTIAIIEKDGSVPPFADFARVFEDPVPFAKLFTAVREVCGLRRSQGAGG